MPQRDREGGPRRTVPASQSARAPQDRAADPGSRRDTPLPTPWPKIVLRSPRPIVGSTIRGAEGPAARPKPSPRQNAVSIYRPLSLAARSRLGWHHQPKVTAAGSSRATTRNPSKIRMASLADIRRPARKAGQAPSPRCPIARIDETTGSEPAGEDDPLDPRPSRVSALPTARCPWQRGQRNQRGAAGEVSERLGNRIRRATNPRARVAMHLSKRAADAAPARPARPSRRGRFGAFG